MITAVVLTENEFWKEMGEQFLKDMAISLSLSYATGVAVQLWTSRANCTIHARRE